jgi:hypothetical protein
MISCVYCLPWIDALLNSLSMISHISSFGFHFSPFPSDLDHPRAAVLLSSPMRVFFGYPFQTCTTNGAVPGPGECPWSLVRSPVQRFYFY